MTPKSPGQLVQDHWKFIKRLTNDDDEAQRVALYVLEKFKQFKPERGAFATFIKMKLRELRQHYSDKGVVYHPGRKDAGGYVSLDENQLEGAGDDEEVEVGLYNLIATLPPPDVPSWLCEVYYEETKSRRPAHCEKLNDLGRCPEPAKLSRRRGRISPATFRRELVAEAAYASRVAARIYFAERAVGMLPLPKDTLWQGGGSLISTDLVEVIGSRKLQPKSIRHRHRRSPFLTWVRRKETDELSPTKAIKKENHDLLWAALRVLRYKRRWPKGIPSVKIFPTDRFSPRERVLRQAEQVVAASCKRTRWRRPLIRIRLQGKSMSPRFGTPR